MTGNVVRLRDDDSEWGMSRVDYTLMRRRLVRERELARRALWQQRSVYVVPLRDKNGLFVAAPKLNEGDVFVTSSGERAYRGRVPNRLSLTSAAINEQTRHELISLPYVSILFAAP